MKKLWILILTLLLCTALLLSLAACGSQAYAAGLDDAGITVAGVPARVIVTDFIAAAARMLLLAVLLLFSKIIFPLVTKTIIPYLENKHLMGIVRIFVASAEKKGETGEIEKANKKEYVIGLLEKRGVPITPLVLEMIEAAVEELDNLQDQFVKMLLKEKDAADEPADGETPDGGKEP